MKDYLKIIELLEKVKKNQETANAIQEKFFELQALLKKQNFLINKKDEEGSFLSKDIIINEEIQKILNELDVLLNLPTP